MRKKNIIYFKHCNGLHNCIGFYLFKFNTLYFIKKCKNCDYEKTKIIKKYKNKFIFSNILREKEREQKK